MSLLCIYRKAKTERDSQTLLDASKRIKDPFGGRVHYISNSDFYGSEETMIKSVTHAFREAAEHSYGTTLSNDKQELLAKVVASQEFFKKMRQNNRRGAFLSEINLQFLDKNSGTRFGMIIVEPDDELTPEGYFKIQMPEELDTRTTINQLKYYILWHENAHVTGCREPQADAISLLMYRQAFEDQRLLPAIADHRMIETLSGDRDIIAEYGWQNAQAIDYIASLDQNLIDGLSEDNMWEIGMMDFENKKSEISRVLFALFELYEQNHGEDAGISISQMAPIAQRLSTLDIFEADSPEKAYLDRMNLALTRATNPEMYLDNTQTLYTPTVNHTFGKDKPTCLNL